jgi:pimeloyl-ACP methyl ester carboxylesterase
MQKAMRRPIMVISIVLAVLAAALVFFVAGRGTTPPVCDGTGKPLAGSIAVLEEVPLGGMKQWLLIRGRDMSNPVLLWLHGGPGAAQMPIARHFNGGLEKDFVVVHWDQRGAGKSNPPDFDESTMTFRQFFDDAHQLTHYLKERFERERIYLVGHSWGTQLGLKLAQAYPEDYYAYVGISQVVDPAGGLEVGRAWLLEQVEDSENEEDGALLRGIGPPPYADHDDFVKFIKLISKYGGDLDVGMVKLVWVALRAPEYRITDFTAWLRGANRGSGPMWDSPVYQSYNAMRQVPRIMVPVYFFAGRKDYNTPLEITREYIEMLDAPCGKELVVFEESAHTPFMAEPEKFNRELVRVKGETFGRGRERHAGIKGQSALLEAELDRLQKELGLPSATAAAVFPDGEYAVAGAGQGFKGWAVRP